jgi:hypothetical protein
MLDEGAREVDGRRATVLSPGYPQIFSAEVLWTTRWRSRARSEYKY